MAKKVVEKMGEALMKLVQKMPSKGTIIRYFPNTHMCYQHASLADIARDAGLRVENLRPGEFLVFMNRPQTALKVLGVGGTLIYFRMPGTEVINPEIIPLIPFFVCGGKLNYQGALKEVITKSFDRS
jgi:hypothetical protein